MTAPLLTHTQRLLCHPATPCAVAVDLTVQMVYAPEQTAGNRSAIWQLTYRLSGEVSALKIPAPAPRKATDGLWHHTCFEAFVSTPDKQAYRELNFSPSGQWAIYDFSQYRQRDETAQSLLPAQELGIDITQSAHALSLRVLLSGHALPCPQPGGPTVGQWGLSAVLEDHSGALSYWALHHPTSEPDFHHRQGWSLLLPSGL